MASNSRESSKASAVSLRILPANTLPAAQQTSRVILVLDGEQLVVVVSPPGLLPVDSEGIGLVAVGTTAGGDALQGSGHVLEGGDLLLTGLQGAVPGPAAAGTQLPNGLTPGGGSTGGALGVVVQDGGDDGDVGGLAVGKDELEEVHQVGATLGGLEDVGGNQATTSEVGDTNADGAGGDILLIEVIPGREGLDDGGTTLSLSVGGDLGHGGIGFSDREQGGHVDKSVASDVTTPAFLGPLQGVVDNDVHEGQDVGGVAGELDDGGHEADGGLDAVSALEDNTKGTTTATTQGPEEVLVLAFIGDAQLAIRSDDLVLDNTVDTKTIDGGQDRVATVHDPTARETDGRGVTTEDGNIVLVSKLVGFIEVNTSTGSDGVVGGLAAIGDKGRAVAEVLQLASPQGQGTLAAAAGQVVMTTVLDGQTGARAVGEVQSVTDIGFILHLDVVGGHITLTAGLVDKSQRIGGIAAVEQALILGVGRAHLILIVHVTIGRVGAKVRIGVVILDVGTGGIVGGDGLAVVVGEAREGERSQGLHTTLKGSVEAIQSACATTGGAKSKELDGQKSQRGLGGRRRHFSGLPRERETNLAEGNGETATIATI